MPNRVAAAQISLTAAVLGGYGVWGLIRSWHSFSWLTAIVSAASIAAAVGVALRKQWSRPLVLLLAAPVVGAWLLMVCLASTEAYRRGVPMRDVIISVMPFLLSSGIGMFCCYVVAIRLRSSRGQI